MKGQRKELCEQQLDKFVELVWSRYNCITENIKDCETGLSIGNRPDEMMTEGKHEENKTEHNALCEAYDEMEEEY